MRKVAFLILVLTLILAVAGCSHQPLRFGEPQKAAYKDISLTALMQRQIDMLMQPVRVEMRFVRAADLKTEDGKRAFVAEDDFNQILVLVPTGVYDEALVKAEQGDPVIVYGYPTTIQPNAARKAQLALDVAPAGSDPS
ncbi:hypothetical protein KDL45_03770 [bacterium]|nr:hypothetical protein [bacterium]